MVTDIAGRYALGPELQQAPRMVLTTFRGALACRTSFQQRGHQIDSLLIGAVFRNEKRFDGTKLGKQQCPEIGAPWMSGVARGPTCNTTC